MAGERVPVQAPAVTTLILKPIHNEDKPKSVAGQAPLVLTACSAGKPQVPGPLNNKR